MHVKLLLNLVCMVLMGIFNVATTCLIISEVNCDNPKLDTHEFVELYNDGSNPASLDGYALVFYNGNGDFAYHVINLTGHQTDQQGYFLVGSSELNPRPAIVLLPNSVQNGPDAIALYGPNWTPVPVGGHVSRVGLLDAVVYTSRKSTEGADGLASVLTPGSVPYVEDERALEGDESIQRCWQSENLWTFHTGPPTPGWINHCPPPTPSHVWINEVDLGGLDQKGLVELSVGMVNRSFSVVLYDVTTDLISSSVEFIATEAGIFTLSLDTAVLSVSQSVALAVYKGPASEFPKGSTLSHQQPIDAFVYSDSIHMPSDNLTEMLIPGRKPFILTESFHTVGVYGSRCGVAEWTRDPGLFVMRPRSPGKANDCAWFQSCPRNISSLLHITDRTAPAPFHSNYDFLLSEINSDSQGAAEDEEFIELWHPSGFRMSLDFIWLVMINGQTGEVYFEQELSGYYTDDDGYFLIGSAKLAADITIKANTVQNGPDAIALYRSESPPSKGSQSIPTEGLLDAVVYRTRGSDKKASELTEVLTPGQLPLLEDINAFPGDETLTRCGADRLNLNAYRVASPTPRKRNDCPATPTIAPPPEGVILNEFGVDNSWHPYVELSGPPLTSLLGIILVFFVDKATTINYPLTGSIGSDGLYLLKNDSSADQGLPVLKFSAVVLCFELSGSGICGADSRHLDRLIMSNETWLPRSLRYSTSDIKLPDMRYPVPGLDSTSRCATDGPTQWVYSQGTPRLQNLCPSPARSISVDLCLQTENNDWQGKSGSCDKEGFADLLEQFCKCGITSLHLKGVNVSCVLQRVHAVGSVFAAFDEQRVSLTSRLNDDKLLCPAGQERQVQGAGASVGLQVGLVLTAILLFALGAALFVYLYKKRRPADYLSMQLSEQAETPLQL